MMDLIDRAAAIETLGEPHPLDYNRISAVEKIRGLPSVEAVPLDKLCEWLAERYEPPYTREGLDNMEFPMKIEHLKRIWKRALTKWMEKQEIST